MKVSVVISTYNRPAYLKRSIDGFLGQYRPPDEIVIADDGSRHKTAMMVESFQESSPCKILHAWHKDKGFRASRIRNKAVSLSSGDYLILCDDDIIPDVMFVEDHLKYAEAGCFIQGHRVLLGEEASQEFTFNDLSLLSLLKLLLKGQVRNISNALRFPIPVIRKSYELRGIRSCNMSFFRKDFIAVNGFNEDFIGWGKEDSELAVRFYNYGLQRKDVRFRFCCIHLQHANYPRHHLARNSFLLDQAIKDKEYFCVNGIDKYLRR